MICVCRRLRKPGRRESSRGRNGRAGEASEVVVEGTRIARGERQLLSQAI
jgi:hypothetical protein